MHLSYKPPSYRRILFRSGGLPRQFSCLKKLMDLVVPVRGFRKGIILQGRHLPSGLSIMYQSCLVIKGDVTWAYVHTPIYSNSAYVQTFRQSIYDTIWPEHPYSPIHQYKRRPQVPALWPCYKCQSFFCPALSRGGSKVSRNISSIIPTRAGFFPVRSPQGSTLLSPGLQSSDCLFGVTFLGSW